MPNPVTNAQIEDVLSSIRRLVSEDSQSSPGPDAGRNAAAVSQPRGDAQAEALASGVDRLVLTPSLRIDEKASAPVAPVSGTMAEETMAGSGQPEVSPIESYEFEAEPRAFDAVEDSDDAMLQASGHEWMEPIEEATTGDLTAALGRVGAHQPDVAMSADPEEEEAPFVEPSFQSSRSDSLSSKIAALEAAIGRTRDQWEPDGDSADAYAGTRGEAISWQDHVEGPRQQAGASAPQSEAPTAEDEAVMDEDALRELVAEIVRQELQGALGERITRNVRKLVRREIHRAMVSQDLE
ncbi:hypothetical protein [Pseudodonghicola xiamenensis]|uniref:Uncharacterized protein n=1 Tax=Pseudodonghicola xiamenensis TaxID=337702 RepID=A0A8J3MCJ0_9RHOB|nr:hypothetical protein [Pseudodonghicola xiamenensis]GHG91827.1 hypothetical protein GCM10010961_23480 [Pseudodonghicola xiamenensis]